MSDGAIFLLFFCLPMVIFFGCVCVCIGSQSDCDGLAEEVLRAPVVLPSFPYSRRRQAGAAPPACAICLDELRLRQLCSEVRRRAPSAWTSSRLRQLCSEVPACRHIFHEGCIRAWARKKSSCPLCRAKIVEARDAGDTV
ncbi:unnamed protein product [Urochloa humidicola]